MVGITGMSINSATPLTTGLQVAEQVRAAEADNTDKTEESGKAGNGVRAEDTPGKAEAAGQGESSEPGHITQLREMIKQLQKQMAEEQKQLAMLMAQKMDETTKLSMVMAKQASIATISGQIQAATAQLLKALTESGGSSAGGMVSTQA
ncbi:hypothetical protein JYG34_15390 [Pseudomonas entomophila]|uniref:hypothetical protein n=1 Tax=Pseudomonas entomophila TaxID=312306 RepID=UPI001BCC5491|nr:hypothetical protein [Pseudomonas entomophila]QVM89414.1 hypothetical protein JYG34_15390 [Pseudomonas entomophila]